MRQQGISQFRCRWLLEAPRWIRFQFRGTRNVADLADLIALFLMRFRWLRKQR
jgi:hypothetical protein